LRRACFAQQKTGSAKESLHVTEIETNELLKQVRRPASASGETVTGPGGRADEIRPAPVMAASLLAGVEIGSNAGLLFIHF
jgi:hypothetical protein